MSPFAKSLFKKKKANKQLFHICWFESLKQSTRELLISADILVVFELDLDDVGGRYWCSF